MAECWQKIGVWSKQKRCPVLQEVVHCRNCEVFIQSGRRLLDQDLPDTYRSQWADIMASEKKAAQFQTLSLILFRIESEWLALRTQVLSEVIDPQPLKHHSLPHRKNRVLTGIINVRGEIQLCVSLKELLGIEQTAAKPSDQTPYQRMMVIDSEDGKWVFPVSEIIGIHRIHPATFQNVPVTVAKAQSTFTKGIFKWEERYVAFLDDELLIYSLTRSVQ
jgi:chemotaxis-related protein WspD